MFCAAGQFLYKKVAATGGNPSILCKKLAATVRKVFTVVNWFAATGGKVFYLYKKPATTSWKVFTGVHGFPATGGGLIMRKYCIVLLYDD